MTAAANFIEFVTDDRVIYLLIAAFTMGGVVGMKVNEWTRKDSYDKEAA